MSVFLGPYKSMLIGGCPSMHTDPLLLYFLRTSINFLITEKIPCFW